MALIPTAYSGKSVAISSLSQNNGVEIKIQYKTQIQKLLETFWVAWLHKFFGFSTVKSPQIFMKNHNGRLNKSKWLTSSTKIAQNNFSLCPMLTPIHEEFWDHFIWHLTESPILWRRISILEKISLFIPSQTMSWTSKIYW